MNPGSLSARMSEAALRISVYKCCGTFQTQRQGSTRREYVKKEGGHLYSQRDGARKLLEWAVEALSARPRQTFLGYC